MVCESEIVRFKWVFVFVKKDLKKHSSVLFLKKMGLRESKALPGWERLALKN